MHLDTIRQHLRHGRYQEAREALSRLCRDTPVDAETLCLLGAVNGELGRYDETVSCCRQAISLQPGNVAAHNYLAHALMQLGEAGSAVDSFREVARLQPGNADALNMLAMTQLAAGDPQAARESLQQSLIIRPAHADTYVCLGDVYRQEQHPEEAARQYRRVLDIDPDNVQAGYRLADCLADEGRYQEAVPHYERALKAHPGFAAAKTGLAFSYERLGEYDRVYPLLQPVLETDRPDPMAAHIYAGILATEHRYGEAVDLLRNALAASPPDNVRVLLHYKLGSLLESMGSYSESFAHYRQANELQPASMDPLADVRTIRQLMEVFAVDFMRTCPRSTNDSDLPVFIVGMPRSGTSLVEQILSCHPQVHAAGELLFMNEWH